MSFHCPFPVELVWAIYVGKVLFVMLEKCFFRAQAGDYTCTPNFCAEVCEIGCREVAVAYHF